MATHGPTHVSAVNVEAECIELTKVERHIGRDIERAIGVLDEADSLKAEAKENIDNLVRLFEELHLCLTARLYGYQIMAVVSEDPDFLSDRLKAMRRDIDETLVTGVKQMRTNLVRLLDKEGPDKDMLSFVKSLRKSGKLVDIVHSVDGEEAVARNLLEMRGDPISIMLKVDGPEVKAFAVAEV